MNISFENLIIEIHRINKAWHTYETINRFLNKKNKYIQHKYLKEKNQLQDILIKNHTEKIEIKTLINDSNPSILIKEEYQFKEFKDACHMKKEDNK